VKPVNPVPNVFRLLLTNPSSSVPFAHAIIESLPYFDGREFELKKMPNGKQESKLRRKERDAAYLECLRVFWENCPDPSLRLGLFHLSTMPNGNEIPSEILVAEFGRVSLLNFLLFEQMEFKFSKVIDCEKLFSPLSKRPYKESSLTQNMHFPKRYLKVLVFLKRNGFEIRTSSGFFVFFHFKNFSQLSAIFSDEKSIDMALELFGNQIFLPLTSTNFESFFSWLEDSESREVRTADAIATLDYILTKSGGKISQSDRTKVEELVEQKVVERQEGGERAEQVKEALGKVFNKATEQSPSILRTSLSFFRNLFS